MHFSTLRKISASLFLGALTISAYGQDLLASQAPIDRQLKAVDSISLKHLQIEEAKSADDGNGLYSNWNTQYAHCYSEAAVPENFKIDLRDFAMPIHHRVVTSNFGYRPRFRRMHKGVDIKAYTGDTVRAAFSGKVRVVRYEGGGYGNYVVIRHHNGLETIYGHLSKHLTSVNREVKAGDPIGLAGNTGRSFGSHLHFETRILGEAIDPALIFDFKAGDVRGDYYVFNKAKNRKHIASRSQSNKVTTPATQEEKRNTTKETPAPVAAVSTAPAGTRYYKVKKGESLMSIAGRLGLSVEKLCEINHIKNSGSIRPDQILKY